MSFGFETFRSLESTLKATGAALEVLQGNVENYSTVGYKPRRVEFSSAFADAVGAPGNNVQGATLISMGHDFSQGSLTGGGQLDAAISGKGLFVMRSEFTPYDLYTRASNWFFDTNGILVDTYRRRLRGFEYKNGKINQSNLVDIQIDLNKYNVEDVGIVEGGQVIGNYQEVKAAQDKLANGDTTVQVPTYDVLYQLAVANVPNPAFMEEQVGTAFRLTNRSGVVSVGVSDDSRMGTVVGGKRESSTVDPAIESVKAIEYQRHFNLVNMALQKLNSFLNSIMNDVVGKA